MGDADRLDRTIEEGDLALDEGDFEAALERFQEALEMDPEHWGAALGEAEALLCLWRTDEALKLLDQMRPADPEEDDPDRAELEGRVREARGEFAPADRLFLLATKLDPDEFPLPVRMSEADFQSILDRVLESLPNVIREAVAEVPVLVTPKPTRDIAERAPHITPDLLGLFVGTSIGEKVAAPSGYGDVVMLFQRNLERAGRSRAEVSKEIRITLLHEYGHYLGFDEEELEHLGLA
jgi:predicted Zn-dependent protease with MMP-like domain